MKTYEVRWWQAGSLNRRFFLSLVEAKSFEQEVEDTLGLTDVFTLPTEIPEGDALVPWLNENFCDE